MPRFGPQLALTTVALIGALIGERGQDLLLYAFEWQRPQRELECGLCRD